jgi:Cu-Zn family superoxide dismutase
LTAGREIIVTGCNEEMNMQNRSLVSLVGLGFAGLLAVASAGCGGDDEPSKTTPGPDKGATEAVAVIKEKSGSTTKGTADFKASGRMVTLVIKVEGAKPGQHAVHIHEFGDCSAPDASSAGKHWNPLNKMHGRWGSESYHLGDIGNLTVEESGTGTLTFSTDEWAIGSGGANDVVGKAFLVHANADDFVTQPDGNAGERIACGVIQKK